MLFNDISYFVSIIDSDKIPSSSIGQTHNDETIKQQIKTQRQVTGGSDSGQGSEADDGIRMAYHFYIPNHLCGKYKKNIDNMNSMYCSRYFGILYTSALLSYLILYRQANWQKRRYSQTI